MSIHAQWLPGRYPGFVFSGAPRNVYWEMTIACDLSCKHCRAGAHPERDPGELTTAQAQALMRDIKEMGSLLILTGGDPAKRPDLFELIEYGRSLHLPMAITPSTTPLLTREHVRRFAELGLSAMGISVDGPNAALHDGFRNVPGTFDCSMRALSWAREYELPVQVNTTLTLETIPHLPELYALLRDTATPPVRRWSLFLLIPVGRGLQLSVPTPERIEELFAWVYETSQAAPFHVGTVEAPQYRRYFVQRKQAEGATAAQLEHFARTMGFGVRDGNGVIFVSHLGEVYPAGFLPYPLLGNVTHEPLSRIYRDSPFLKELRDPDLYKGKCGRCEFRVACGGSRARAYGMLRDPFESDPLCAYDPCTPMP